MSVMVRECILSKWDTIAELSKTQRQETIHASRRLYRNFEHIIYSNLRLRDHFKTILTYVCDLAMKLLKI